MSAYCVATLTITDRAWVRDYVRNVGAIVRAHHGSYLARSGDIEQVEGAGERPELVVILEFPTMEDARAFYHDPTYQPYLKARLEGTVSSFYLVQGEARVASAQAEAARA